MRRKFCFLLSLLSFVIISWSCSQKVSQQASNTSAPITSLKVMSYNIHHANPPSKPGLIDLDAIAEVIKKENPDIVGLQEVDVMTKRSGSIDEAKLLGEKTGMYYQFFKAIDHDGGDYGVAILSKYPIAADTKIALPQVAKGEPRVLSYAEITLPNKVKLTFANTHLDATRPDSNRVAQMKTILTVLGDKKGPVILVGDLNCESKAEPIVLMDQQFKRSCLASCAATIPQDLPRKTIDYIALKNSLWLVSEHRVIAEVYASDHRPLVAVYQLK